jgi:hypothetical protein
MVLLDDSGDEAVRDHVYESGTSRKGSQSVTDCQDRELG